MCVYVLIMVLLANIYASFVNADCDHIEGYYWKDYTGEIPKDALPGGINSKGHTTYIGQVLHKDLIIPAKIDPDEKKVFYEWGYKEHEALENIKVLCTQHPEQFEWIATGNRRINSLRDKQFVVAGYEPGNTQLVGRIQLENELALGKVIFSNGQSTLNTTKDGVGTQHGEFEVLCYKPDLITTKRKKCKKHVTVNFYN